MSAPRGPRGDGAPRATPTRGTPTRTAVAALVRKDLRAELRTGVEVTFENLEALLRETEADLVVLTCPLDAFADHRFGSLDWRGIYVQSVYIPHVEYAQGAMVVNYPALAYPFIRIHETKHASGQKCEGTVLGFEFTNAPTRYYPIELPENRQLNDRYKNFLREQLGADRTYFAGRLANYLYIDMDDCMRQALDATEGLLGDVRQQAVRSARG